MHIIPLTVTSIAKFAFENKAPPFYYTELYYSFCKSFSPAKAWLVFLALLQIVEELLNISHWDKRPYLFLRAWYEISSCLSLSSHWTNPLLLSLPASVCQERVTNHSPSHPFSHLHLGVYVYNNNIKNYMMLGQWVFFNFLDHSWESGTGPKSSTVPSVSKSRAEPGPAP